MRRDLLVLTEADAKAQHSLQDILNNDITTWKKEKHDLYRFTGFPRMLNCVWPFQMFVKDKDEKLLSGI